MRGISIEQEKTIESYHIRVGIIGNPVTVFSSAKFLVKFLKILDHFCNNMVLINDGYTQNIGKIRVINLGPIPLKKVRPISFVITQLVVAFHVMRIRKSIDTLFVLPTFMLFPIAVAKVIGKKTLVFVANDSSAVESGLYSRILMLMKPFIFKLVDRIIVESDSVACSWRLNKYREKVCIGALYVDIDTYNVKKPLSHRKNIVGYIGNLSEGKGVQKLASAIPKILEKNPALKFIIGGRGPIEDKIKLLAERYPSNVQYLGRIPEVNLPAVLNELKMLILPSFTEGLPNIVLEAMACETPVLSTSVGAIPDILENGKTGLLLKDNSPEAIATSILNAIDSPDLVNIGTNAREMVIKHYSYLSALSRYEEIIKNQV
jgi:glycosyltransferase involved in cell wall biosynthesis